MTGLFSNEALPGVVSLDKQIAEVKRELAMRENVYPRWVADGKLKQHLADQRIAAMKAVLVTLEEVARRRGEPV